MQTAAQGNVTSLGTLTGLTVSGDGSFTGDLTTGQLFVGDGGPGATDDNICVGDGKDLKIYHDGNSVIYDNGTGNLILYSGGASIQLKKDTGEEMIIANTDGSVDLYHDDVKRFETTSNGIEITGNATSSVSSLSDGSSIAVDLASASHFTVTLGGNRTFVNSGMNTGNSIGSSGSIFIVQDGTGSRTAAFESAYKFPGGTAPTLSTAANAVDRLDFVVRSADNVHCVVTLDVK